MRKKMVSRRKGEKEKRETIANARDVLAVSRRSLKSTFLKKKKLVGSFPYPIERIVRNA